MECNPLGLPPFFIFYRIKPQMRLLDRYILKELMIPLFFCLAGGLIFYTTFDLFATMDDLRENEAGLWGVILYNLARMPEVLVLILPPALLLALLYAISNHARYNEIVAMRAAGITIWRICAPYLLVGAVLGVGLFYLNEKWVPAGARLAQSIRRGVEMKGIQVYQNVNFSNTKDERIWSIEEYDSNTKHLTRPSVEYYSRNSSGERELNKLIAAEAEWRPLVDGVGGIWEFHDVQLFRYGRESAIEQIPVPERWSVLQVPELEDTPEEIESEIFITGFDSFKSARKANLNLKEISAYLVLHPDTDNALVTRVKTLYYARIASPFTCLIVVLVALPFSLQSGRRNVFAGVASSIVICFCFFLLNEVSLALGEGGYIPPWLSAWLANILFGMGGFIAVRKMA